MQSKYLSVPREEKFFGRDRISAMGCWSPVTVKDKNLFYTGMDKSLERQGKMGSSPKKSYRSLGASGQTSATAETREKRRKLPWGCTGDSSCRNSISKIKWGILGPREKVLFRKERAIPDDLRIISGLWWAGHSLWIEQKSRKVRQGSVMNITEGDKVIPSGKLLLSDT